MKEKYQPRLISSKDELKDIINKNKNLKYEDTILEFYDDYTYEDNKNAFMYVKKYDKDIKLFYGMEKGPRNADILNSMIEWRKTCINDEIGHMGGGNTRFCMKHEAIEVTLYTKRGNRIWSATLKTKFFKDNINQNTDDKKFEDIINSSEHVIWAEEKDEDELPQLYGYINNYIKTNINVEFNFLIYFKLGLSDEYYSDKKQWDKLKYILGMKNYKNLNIYYKNELLDEDKFSIIEKIDLLQKGNFIKKTIKNKTENIETPQKTLTLFICPNNNLYLGNKEEIEKNEIFNIKTKTFVSTDDKLSIATIELFCIDENKFKENYSKIYKSLELKEEDLYGVYYKLNGKMTNYLGDKEIIMASKSFPPYCSKFRILFDFDTEKITSSNLSKILETDTIKTQSKLIHDDKKLLISALTTYYKCDDYIKTRTKSSQSSIIEKSNTFYLIYFGKNLYKFGITNDFDRRLKEHKNDKKEKIRKFCNVEDDDEIITIKTYDIKKTSGRLIEEQLKETIKKNQDFEYFENKNEKNDIREFFKWNKDLDSLIEIISQNVQNNISR